MSSLLLAWTFAPSLIGQQQTTRATEHQRDGADLIRKRAEWFFHQRQFPLGFIPAGAREKAIEQRDQMLREQGSLLPRLAALARTITPNTTTWTPIGPRPTTGTPFGNVSGRILALAVDPRDTTNNTVYLGGAIGGVWKTTDAGTNWTPLTDNMPSLAISALALDTKTNASQTIIYAGTGEGDFGFDSYWSSGLLKSIDSGATWTSIGASAFGAISPINSITEGPFFFSIAVQPNTANPVLLAAVRGSGSAPLSGIWMSTDAGNSWTHVVPASSSATGNIGTDVVFDPTDPTTAYAAIGNPFSGQNNAFNGVYKGTAPFGANNWTAVSITGATQANFGRIALASGPKVGSSSHGVLYAAIADHSVDSTALLGLFASTDGGQTWTKKSSTPNFCAGQCWFDMVVKVSPVNANTLFVGGGAIGAGASTVFRSLDGGGTWTDVSLDASNVPIHVDQHAQAFTPDGTKLYVGNDGGTWSSTDVLTNSQGQIHWANLNSTLQLSQFYPHISVHPSNSQNIIGGAQDNGTQQFSGSLAWTDMAVCGDGGYTAFDPKTPTTIYAGCEYIAGNSALNPLNKSVDGGANFVHITNGINLGDNASFIPPLVIDPTNTQNLYFGTFRVYQTTSAASSWSPISTDLTGDSAINFITSITVAPSDSKTIYVGTVAGPNVGSRVFVSNNAVAGSATFNERDATLPPRSVTQVVVDPTNPQAAYVTFSGFANCPQINCDPGGGHVFHTISGGAAWTNISGNLPDIPVNDIAIDPNDLTRNTLYLGTDIGVFGTIDGGITWSPLALGLPNVEVTTIALHEPSRTLVAGTHGRGAWSLQLPGTAIIGTTTTVTSSMNPSLATQEVTFTAKVAPASGTTTPTGTVQFQLDGTNSGSPINVSSCSPSPDACAQILLRLGAGSHSIVATYSGDTNFSSSTSNPFTQTVNSGNTSPVDFSFGTPSPTSATIPAGQSATFSIPVTPSASSSAGITISCAGLPAATTCTPMPNPVPETGASNVQVTTQTLARSTMPNPTPRSPLPWARFGIWSLLAFSVLSSALLASKLGARRRLAFGLAAGMLVAFAGFQVGCGGGGGTSGGGSPIASFNPTSVTFHNPAVGTTSAAQTVTLTNSGNAALAIASITITGTNSADFALATNNCPASLAAGANCTMTVTLKPSVATTENAAVSVSDNAVGSPQSVALTGTAGTPAGTSTITITGTAGSGAGSFTHTTQVTLTVQ